MHYLDFLLLGWFFWPIDLVLLFIVYSCVKPKGHVAWNDIEPGGLFFGTLLLAVAWFHWRPAFTVSLLYSALKWLGVYIGAGFLVSLYKYWSLLTDFRDAAPLLLEKRPYAYDSAYDLCSDLEYPSGYVDFDKNTGVFKIDWKSVPLLVWWTYWPCFTVSLILDPIQRGIKWLFERMRSFYDALATKYSVRNVMKTKKGEYPLTTRKP
jgi:hypothetical protein